jgi:single-strand DNA-binding protein
MSVNKVILIGNLGSDPEVRYLDTGTAAANFRLATEERYTGKDGQKQTITDWHRIVLYGPPASVAEKYLKKGSKIYLEGRLKTRTWEDKGVKKFITEVRGDLMKMLSFPKDSVPSNEPMVSMNETTPDEPDDLPF